MAKNQITVIIQKGKNKTVMKSPLSGFRRVVIVVNNQFTDSPNVTQIASGAGKSSAAGSNAAIKSPNTTQQQSVGAGGGKAKNIIKKKKKKASTSGVDAGTSTSRKRKEIVIVVNNQTAKLRGKTGAATQVASGAGRYSTGGTNSAIESSRTKQQHAVAGGKGSRSTNKMKKGIKKK